MASRKSLTRHWNPSYLPGLTGAVRAALVPPVVGKIIQAAGDGIVAQFKGIVGNE